MSERLESALRLAANGFFVFPLYPGGKTPAHKGWQDEATRDHIQIRAWFEHNDFNVGVFTGKYGDGSKALLVVDIDNKGAKRGDDELIRLELEGLDLPATRETTTPTGGRHLYFEVDEPVKQGANVLAQGLDIRSRGGFVVGPGSVTKDGAYVEISRAVAPSPQWLVDRCGRGRARRQGGDTSLPAGLDAERANQRAIAYLRGDAPVAVEGQGGDQTTYQVACRVKDFGLSQVAAFEVMADHWNPRCSPPWDDDDLRAKIRNAYSYGLEPPGVAAPEIEFGTQAVSSALHPFDKLNKEYAFVLSGGAHHILWETTNATGGYDLVHLNEQSFHKKFASERIQVGDKSLPLTSEWIKYPKRRTYDGIVFMPQQRAPARFFNLWRGFSCAPWPDDKPVTPEAQESVDMFLAHARENVCNGDSKLFNWLMGYFAHLIQRPWEKPLVALVFRGEKGVGKNALIERVGALLGGHFLVTSNRRYLVGNFNGHLENCLMFVLDEAFWSGDKQAEGVLKDLITGKHHVIEHKGKEHYLVDNRTRVAIIGNEEWIVPASADERRFAVFDVGPGRKQDRDFFRAMREQMEAGGYPLLLRTLQRWRIGDIDVDAAPSTGALLDQKHASLEPLHKWWHLCLYEGRIVASDFAAGWTETIDCDRFRAAFHRWCREHNHRGRFIDERSIGRELRKACPSVEHVRAPGEGGARYAYRVPSLAGCRAEWDRFIQHKSVWPD